MPKPSLSRFNPQSGLGTGLTRISTTHHDNSAFVPNTVCLVLEANVASQSDPEAILESNKVGSITLSGLNHYDLLASRQLQVVV